MNEIEKLKEAASKNTQHVPIQIDIAACPDGCCVNVLCMVKKGEMLNAKMVAGALLSAVEALRTTYPNKDALVVELDAMLKNKKMQS